MMHKYLAKVSFYTVPSIVSERNIAIDKKPITLREEFLN